MKEIHEMSNQELHDLVRKGVSADQFLNSELGKMLQEAAKRIIDRATTAIALQIDPTDISKVWEMKLTIRKYKYGLFDEIKMLVQDGFEASDELQKRRESDPLTDIGYRP